MRTLLAFALVLCLPALAGAGMVFDVVPSSDTDNTNGLEFSPLGGDLVVTNTLTYRSGDVTVPLYLDFGVGYDRTDAAGNVFYQPKTEVYQLYVLDRMLGSVTLPPSTVVARGMFVGPSEAFALGDGIYDYRAAVLGSTIPGNTSPLDTAGTLSLRFDTRQELGHQVLGGTLDFGTSAAAPEPASALLLTLGGLLAWPAARWRARLSR